MRKIQLVITRHPALVQYLLEEGIVGPDTPVIDHATAGDVRGTHVLGVLPHHLSAAAATITEVPLRLTLADRKATQKGDLPVSRIRQIAGAPVTYQVRIVPSANKRRKPSSRANPAEPRRIMAKFLRSK